MTAHTVGSTPATAPAAAPAARSTLAAGAARDPLAPGHFDRQLHAARQRTASRDAVPTPMGPNARALDSGPRPLTDSRADVTGPGDPKAGTAASPTTLPTTVTPPPVAALAQTGEPAVAGTPDAKAPTDTAEPDDHGAAALAGAMLALIAPSVAGVLRPAGAAASKAADVLAKAGKSVATDAQAAMLLQLGDATGAAAAVTDPAPAAVAGMLTAANGLLPVAATARDASSHDLLPAMAASTPPAPAAPTTPSLLQLQSPPGSHGFAQELGQQVAWLGGQDIKQARIRLHPEELGSLDVKVSVSHGRVDVVFSAQHPGAVAAVQQSLPQLDQMLAQHGLSLGHAEVGQQDRGERQGHAAEVADPSLDGPGEIQALGTTSMQQIGLLDAFA